MPARRLALALLAALSFHGSAFAVGGKADFARERPARPVRVIGDWVVASHDNAGSAFFIVDKRNARLYVFDARGRLQGAAAVLLGLARGDDSVPGIGEKKLADIEPWERTTPAPCCRTPRDVDASVGDAMFRRMR